MRLLLVCLLCIFSTVLSAQQSNIFIVHHLFANNPLKINEFYSLKNKDTISIQTLKYYISSIQLLNNKKITEEELEKKIKENNNIVVEYQITLEVIK